MSFKKILNDLRLQSSRIKSVIHKSLQSETMNADDIEATVFEDRVMYSASPLVALPQEMIAQETDGLGETQPVQDELSSSPRHIVFVDSSVEDYESLIEDSVIASDDATEVVILSNDRDGIEQISDFLTSNSGIESIHVVSHGSDGRVNLGNSQLNAQTVNAYASQFVQWRSALTDGADILFYGCNLAETEEGEFLIQAISELTLADVAASDDLTGHAELGGDWDLEFSVGEIESNFVFSNAFSSSWFSTLDIKSELIAHYQFEENGGSTVYDVTANYNDGSWFHAPAWSADSVVGNYSLDFSGDTVNNNAVVTVLDDPTLDFSEDFSIAFWYHATIAQADGTQIIGSHDGNDGFSIYADANGDLNFLLEGSSSSTTRKETNGFISDGNWHHIVATRSGNTIRIYIDNNANGINSVPIGDVDVSAPLLIGGEGTTGANFEGKLDDIRIYGRALSSTDISELYNANGGVAITVDTTTDNVDGNTTNLIDLISNRGADGFISLREAVLAAENTVGPTTIHLGSGVHTLTSGGNLTINSDVTISGVAQGSVIDASSLGDRIFHVIGGSQLSLEDLVLTGGSANGAGGGAVLVASGSSLIADDVVFTGNDATGWGGAIQNFGDVVLNDVAIVNNSATRGGGIRTSVGTLTMTNTTISGNFSAEQGGGIDTDSGTVNANHVSIIDNTSLTSQAGGVHAHGTVAFNTQNSIFADNTASVGGNDIDGTINSLGFNFVEDTDNVTGLEATDITGADPMLNPLQEINGTFVHTLQAGSLAIDAGTFTANLFDQIGEFRVGNADIGAVEYVIADLTTGLFIHHEYEENSGLTANDSSGNNNSGTLINGAAWTGNHAIGNHALDFTTDSTANSYVSVPYDPSLDIASNFAISFWYNADAHAGSTADIIRQFSIGDGFFISHNASGDLLFLIQGSGGTGFVAADNGFVPDSNWHHVVAQKNGTDLEIYIDGSLSASNSNFTGTVSSFEPFLIGGSDTSDYDGLLDDVRGYSRALGGADIAALYAMESGSASTAQTFTVTNTADSGAGSLRQAIMDANANLGADTIDFNIAGSGTQVIQLSSALPTLTEQVTIDGTTQTGWIADTFLPIVIDGNGLNNTGLILNQNADGSTIKGLVVRDFSSIGISAQNNSDNHTIQGNFIGAFQSDGSFDNTSVQSPSSGIYLDGNSSVVGGIGIGESNRFVGSAAGIWISTGDNHQIIGNQMGYVASPNVPVGNPIYGILVQGSDNLISDNTIVGSSVHGINVELGTGNELRRNSISQSDGLGINLGTDGRSANDAGDTDSGANNLQNWAVLTSVSIADDGTFEYVLDTTSLGLGTYSVDFFASSDRDGGQVEGQRFLGTVSGIANGLSSLTGTLSGITLAPGEHVTAVTTDSLGNSSEFSNYAVAVDSDTGGTTPLDLQAVSTNESGLQLNQGGGNNAYLETSEAVFNDNGQITIEVEFSVDSPAVGLTTLFSYADSDSQDELFLAVDSSGEVFFRTSENGGLGYGSTAVSTKLFDGDLHTVSVTWDSASGVIMFYVDGQQLGLGRNSYQTGTTISSTGTVVIGQHQSAPGQMFNADDTFSGTIRRVRLFDTVRTLEQIDASYQTRLPYDESNLIAQWNFDQLSSDGVVLDSVSGNNLTLRNTAETGFTANDATLSFSVDENQVNGAVVGSVAGIDAEREALIASLLAADPDLRYSSETGKFYKNFVSSVDASTAESNAPSEQINGVGGRLLSIRSSHEQQIAFALASAGGRNVWLGGNDVNSEGVWRWQDGGTQLDQFWQGGDQGYNLNGAYSNWLSNEPNNSGGNENYLELRYQDGLWNDSNGTILNAYIVEWTVDDVLDANQAITYSIETQTVPGAFEIDSNTGEIRVLDGNLLDAESQATHAITIRTSDVDGNHIDNIFSISINDLVENNNAPIDLSSGIELNLDGGNDAYLETNNAGSILDGLTEFTIEMKVQLDAFAGDTSFFSYAVPSEDNEILLNNNSNDDTLRLTIGSDFAFTSVSTAALLDGNVHDIAVSWSSPNGDYRIWIDGELAESGSGLAATHVIRGSGTLVFGQELVGDNFDPTESFSGVYHDVRIWDQSRSDAEIKLNQHQKFDNVNLPDSLIANWQMDGFNGFNEVVDIVNGNNLSLKNVGNVGGFLPSSIVGDLNVKENATDGTSIGFVTPEFPSVLEDIATDGFFEKASYPGAFTTYFAGQQFGDWTVEKGAVDLHGTVTQAPPLGRYAVDLDGTGSAISTELETEIGKRYQVIFAFAGNWGTGGPTGEDAKDVRVSAAGSSADFTIERDANWSDTNMLWQNRSVQFTADTDLTKLRFESLDTIGAGFGPMIADVQVIEISPAINSVLNADSTLSYDAATGKFYRFVEDPVSWTQAQTDAGVTLNGVKGQLAVIRSSYENQLLQDMILPTGWAAGWLGGSDEVVEGEFRWYEGNDPDGTFWIGDQTGASQPDFYTNFIDGEPFDFGGQDSVLLYASSGKWDDADGTNNNAYFVEWDANEVITNFTFSLTDDSEGRFAINHSTGEITVADGYRIDGDTQSSYDIDVQVTDAIGNTYVETMAIAVNQVDELNSAPTDLSSGIELNLDGGNDAFLDALDGGAILGGLTSVTFETSFTIKEPGTKNVLVSYATTTQQNAFLIELRDNGDIVFVINGNPVGIHSFNEINYFAALADGNRHSFGLSWDNTDGDVAIYVDGELIESRSGIATGANLVGGSGNGRLVFGNELDSIAGDFQVTDAFRGTLYDVRIWDQIRSEAEISLSHQQKLDTGVVPDGLIANWQMDGFNTENEVVNWVNGNNLTIGHATGAGFTTSTPISDLHINENAIDGASVGYLVPSDPDAPEDIVDDGLFHDYGNNWTNRGAGNVLYQNPATWEPSPLGGNSIELGIAGGPGGIEQDLGTESGQTYQVIFALSGDFDGGDTTKELVVSAGSTSQNFSIDQPDGWSQLNRLWEHRSFTFTADSNSTLLTFDSLEFDVPNRAAIIADIQVIEIPQAISKILGDDPSLQYNAATGKFYRMSPSDATWVNAQTAAVASKLNGVNGQLVTIGSAYENSVVRQLSSDLGLSPWLGASDVQTEGVWRWYNGTGAAETIWSGDENGSATPGQYANFGYFDMDATPDHDFARLDNSTGFWSVSSGSDSHHYLIEWDASQVLSSFSFQLTDDAGGRFAINSSTGELTVADSSQLDFEASTSHDVTVEVTDGAGNIYAETVSITIDNGLDVFQTVPGPQTVAQGQTLSFTVANGNQVTVGDSIPASDTRLQVSISVNDGVLDLSQTGGFIFVDGSNGSGSFTIDGTESDINAALAGMTFTPNGGFNGAVSLDMSTSLSADLEGRFSFDDATANNQAIGSTENGTLLGNASVINDPERGQVLSLDGVSDYVEINSLFNTPNSVTLSAWVNLNSTGTEGSQVISLGDDVFIRLDATGTGNGLTGFFFDGTALQATSSSEFLAGSGWHHVAYTIDFGTSKQAIYLNGEVVAQTDHGGGIVYRSFDTLIGSDANRIGTWDFDGLIDEARIHSRALSADEIALLATDSLSVSDTISITVAAENLMPTINFPATVGTNEDTAVIFAGANIIEVDDGVATDIPTRVSLSVGNGTLTLAATNGITIVEGADGTDSMVIEGLESDVNFALDGLQFDPDQDYNGPDTITVSSSVAGNLNGRYTFEGNANDQAAGVQENGTLIGTAVFANDPTRGDVLSLDGSGQVNIPSDFGQTTSVTLTAWVNVDPGAPTGVVWNIGGDLSLRVEGNGGWGLFAAFNDGTQWQNTISNQMLGGTGWRHVAYAVDDIAQTQILYLDGIEVGQTSFTQGIANVSALNESFIGSNSSTNFFEGMIDDARIYSRSLFAEEIAALANDQFEIAANVVVTVDAVNDQPQFNNLDGNPTFTEGGLAQVLDSDATFFDADINRGEDDFDSVDLQLQRIGGANPEDLFSATGQLGILTEGGSLIYDGSNVGVIINNSNGLLTVRFNGSATQADVDGVIQSIAYSNTSQNPPPSVQITWSMEDANGTQGSGGNLFATGSTNVDINPNNDAPEIANLANDTLNYNEGDGLQVIDQGIGGIVTDVDSANFDGGILTVSFFSGANHAEDLLAIVDTGTGPGEIGLSGNNINFEGILIGSFSGGASGVDLQIALNANADEVAVSALVQAIGYQNTNNDDPSVGPRTVSFVLTDGDGAVGPNYDLTVNVAAVNDEQVLTNITGDTVAEGSTGNIVTTAMLQTTDVDNSETELVYWIDDSPVNGTLFLNGVALADGDTLTQADIDNGRVTYDHDSSETVSDSFEFVVDDGLGLVTSATFSWTIIPLSDDAPMITSNGGGAVASIMAAENTTVVTTVTSVDNDVPADTLTFSIVGGDDSALFTIDSVSGELSFDVSPNRESPTDLNMDSVYEVIVQVDDGTSNDSQAISVEITDVDEFDTGSVTDNDPLTNQLDENSAIGSATGLTAFASDADATTNGITYLLTDDDGGRFAIDTTTGVVTTAAMFDFETEGPSRSITVRATSADGSYSDQSFSIDITDVNEAPDVSLTNLISSLPENIDPSVSVKVADIVIDDDAIGSNLLGLAGTDASSFEIINGELHLRAGVALDFESRPQLDVTVTVDDAGVGVSPDNSANYTLSVADVDDTAPVIQPGQSLTVDENSPLATVIGSLLATDVDTASNLTDWSILGGNEDGNFSFDLSSGNLLVADNVNLNFESNSTYVLTVAVSDGSQTSVPETIVVNVSDVNERPVALPESLVTDQFEGLFVLTPGVLGNDTDVDGDVLAAALISGPSNGTLSLAPDGSIIYTPLGDFFGRDSFTYFATDGLLNSLPVTVEVFVQPIGNSINHQTSNYQVESTPSLVVTQVPITPVTNPVEASLQQAKKVLGIQHLPQSTIAESQPQVLVAADVEEDPFADEEGPEKIYEDQERNFQPIRRIQKLSSRVTSSNSSERISTTRLSAAPIRNSSFGDEMEEPGSGLVDNLVVGTTAITTASLSVGYVLWIVRGGTLMASFVSTLPAWTSFDPLPIVKNSGLDDDSESLVDIAEKGMERHHRDKLND